jgi:hypothetical protein
MPRYVAGHAYTARRDGHTFGPWAAGDVVELDQADADWVNRDSPGALDSADEPSSRPPGKDKAHRSGNTRGGTR